MRQYIPVITFAAAFALVLALLLGVLLPSDNVVYAVAPEFDDNTNSREVPENTPPGVNIGDPISATDGDEGTLEFGNTLTYSLEGTDAASFDIDPSTGQLITKAPLDYETKFSYSVTVTVDDGESRQPPIMRNVTITVTNVDEPPAAPVPPTVVSGPDIDGTDENESTTSLKVVWHPPENTGRPNINNYLVEYKRSTGTDFGSGNQSIVGTTITITGLVANTSYQVRVRASNDDDNGPWSLVGMGSTNKAGNSAPSFNDPGSLVELDVSENTPAGEDIDSPVSATDQDTTTLTYQLGGPDADLFNFNTRSGQILTKAPLNHEDARCGYIDGATPSTECTNRVTVIVVDGAGGSDAMAVEIEVDDKDEPASAPARPTVRAKVESSTSLVVSWNPPANTGPPITSYDVQYRTGAETFSSDGVVMTGTNATISGTNNDNDPWLDPNTPYEVRVRAQNDERTGPWSASGTGRTNRANHQPIFDARPGTEDTSVRGSDFTVSLTIDENPRSGQVVGRVFADDEDNDRLTYKLVESADADDAREELSKFTINETTGEIRTKAGEAYSYEDIDDSGTCDPLNAADVGSDRCYTVKVEVRDGLNEDRVEEEEEEPDDSITLKIGLRDRDERPAVPTVTVTSPAINDGNATLVVVWHAENTGPTPITYDVQYRKGGGAFLNDNCQDNILDDNCDGLMVTNTTITGLDEDTSYSVQVRAKNDEGTSTRSSLVTLKTNKDTNEVPGFLDTGEVTRDVAENTSSGRVVRQPCKCE